MPVAVGRQGCARSARTCERAGGVGRHRVLPSDLRTELICSDLEVGCVADGAEYVSLDRLFGETDIVSLHCPLMASTHHLIDAAALARMKRGVMLINTSRGALLDTRAVLNALKSGHVGYLGIDVYEEEEGVFFEDGSATGIQDDVLARLTTFPNVLVTGHQAFLTQEALANIAETTLSNVACVERGEVCPNRIEAR